MSIDDKVIFLYKELWGVCPPRSVCDLGSQDVALNDTSLLWHGRPARDFMLAMGFERYVCIDIDGRDGTLPLDLNAATFADIGEQFDVVTNHGTIEHCLNQHNCFKLVHDITKVGGLMIHNMPSWPYCNYNDCFYHVTTELFENLAEANSYEKVRCELYDNNNGKYALAVLRRTTDASFVTPIQKIYRQS